MTDRIGPTTPPHGSALGVCLCGSRWCVRAPRTRNCTGPAQPPFWIRAMRPSIQDAPGEGARRPATCNTPDPPRWTGDRWSPAHGKRFSASRLVTRGLVLPELMGAKLFRHALDRVPSLSQSGSLRYSVGADPILRGASCRPSSDPYVQVRRKALGSLWPSSQRSAVANRSGAFRRPKPLAAAAANPASASDAPRFQPASVSPRKVKPT